MATHMIELPWQRDWEEFVRYLANCFIEGRSSDVVAEAIANRVVHWKGQVSANQMNSEHSPGVTMNMPKVQVIIRSGNVFEGEHLGLAIKVEADRRKCRAAKPGDELEFRARIRQTGGPFRTFEFIEDTEQKKVFFMMRLRDVEVSRFTPK